MTLVLVVSPTMVRHLSEPNGHGRAARTLCGVEVSARRDWLIHGPAGDQAIDCLKCARKRPSGEAPA